MFTDTEEGATGGKDALVNESEFGGQDDSNAPGRAAAAIRVEDGGGRGHRTGRKQVAPDFHGLRVPMGLLQENRGAGEQRGGKRSFLRVNVLGLLVLEPTNVPAEQRAHAGRRP